MNLLFVVDSIDVIGIAVRHTTFLFTHYLPDRTPSTSRDLCEGQLILIFSRRKKMHGQKSLNYLT